MPNFRIQLKKKADVEAINKIADKRGLDYTFTTAQDNIDWAEDINSNPDSPQNHLKIKGKEYTIEDLKKTFPLYTKVGLLDADISYSRCPDDQMVMLANFVYENKDSIRFVKDAEELIERGEIKGKRIINCLNKLDKKPLPRLQRPFSDRRDAPTSGQMLVKTWGAGDSKAWLLFGNVKSDSPIFMKEDKFVRPVANNLYKDKEGRAFLLMPLYDFSENFAEVVANAVQKMGIIEHPNYVISGVYTNMFGIANIQEAADSFAECYTKDELIERLDTQIKRVFTTHPSHSGRGLYYDAKSKKDKFNSSSGALDNEASFLNVLNLALESYDKETAFNTVLEARKVA